MTQPTPTKTRTPSMKWIKLGSGKDPEFDNTLVLTDGIMVFAGRLIKIEQEQTGKKYSFNVGLDDIAKDMIKTDITHYCVPVLPTN
jgi:hypothetical protein